MRRRALLLAILVGGIATAGAVAIGGGATPWPDPPPTGAALHAELADVPAPPAVARARDALGHDQDGKRDVPAALTVALVLTLAGGWWLARERAAHVRDATRVWNRRTRAPPGLPTIVHS
jgi:hypothetical protein